MAFWRSLACLALLVSNATATAGPEYPIKVHVVVRTYSGQATLLVGCLASLYAAAQQAPGVQISVAVLDTGDSGHDVVAAVVNAAAAALQVGWSGSLLPSLILRPLMEESKETYGYLASDAEIDLVLGRGHAGSRVGAFQRAEARPHYVLLCNGDTLYALELFSASIAAMTKKYGIIALPWVPTERHRGPHFVKKCEFIHGGVDLNGLFFSTDALSLAGAAFRNLPTPCAGGALSVAGCRATDARPYWVADWGLVYQILKSGRANATCLVCRPLFLQN
ncbi:hypothetical protein M885DRAFT_522745 [Pelagophyceae sp. CCMP2097]|nr:hypothetical protein M885DRAFT_522745 [Pelagophyceae sp. CCMP2097]|mmetsp:Transcript_32716/g.110179  ORF Transcript_32716/g.110179 Transcript_32716/m.110179 type:complete len:278 (+) Transcript_32716:125-958(+)